ncbi:hypothetical protein LEN26_004647 [Aphanomyces euteiches]|nr:hypothetical protein AeMF1_018943 [Aphanomyces euteiches]KAH9147900.1 hypothetical protein LEN26_004647 [Aphanomyces euteiches]
MASRPVRCNVGGCHVLLTVGHYPAHYRVYHTDQRAWKKSMHEDGEVYSILEGEDLALFQAMTLSERKAHNSERHNLLKKRHRSREHSSSEGASQDLVLDLQNDIKEQQEMYMLLGERVEDLEAKIEDLIKTRSEVTKFKERNKLKTLKFRSLVSPTMKHLQW